jgi:plastocyanin
MSSAMMNKKLLTALMTGAMVVLAACGIRLGATPEPITVTVKVTGNCQMDPTTITVRVDQPVTLQFQNLSQQEHSLFIDELQVKVEKVPPGQTGTASFTPTTVRTYTESGAYVFYCDAPGQAGTGMQGNLIVNP